ncbi:uncharacterized protein C20orf85-like [Polypterus senegalus]|uniref:uncharacterized protein C20orf85-like n=1 Tax=Polypterus senegalus TaxID=55291 RepID=UPI001965FFAC|nr:uncharacterized protein C20orf85-like [Polypterus senegalus]
MAAAKPPANPAKTCNFVAQDQIWKSHVHMEEEAARAWPTNWGFLTTSYQELVVNNSEMKKDKSQLELPEQIQTRPTTPPEKYIQVAPSPPLPQTTQGFIGWRSTVPELQLERYGRVYKGQKSFLRDMKWPREAIS